MTGTRTKEAAASICATTSPRTLCTCCRSKAIASKEGWQVSAITSWHTGVPFSIGEGDQMDTGNTFDSQRPNYVASCNLYANRSPSNWFNESCFVPPQYGTSGNLGRNVLVGPGYAETDLSVTKMTKINEKPTLQLRGELFNVSNHANFAPPAATIINAGSSCGPTSTPSCFSPTGAAITSLVGSGGLPDVARQAQFSAKLTF